MEFCVIFPIHTDIARYVKDIILDNEEEKGTRGLI